MAAYEKEGRAGDAINRAMAPSEGWEDRENHPANLACHHRLTAAEQHNMLGQQQGEAAYKKGAKDANATN